MKKQQTFAIAADEGVGFEENRRPTKRDVFMATMNEIVPWRELCGVIEAHYPKPRNGRPQVVPERMLRMYFVQHCFNVAAEACEEVLLDSTALRRFVGVDLGRERVPDATKLLKFRHLLQRNDLGKQLFSTVGQLLQQEGLQVGTSTIVDAPLSSAPSSTKNAHKARDPEMHQTRNGQQWSFEMKLQFGVVSRTRLAHSAAVTAVNVHDKHTLPDLLHGAEQRMYGDSAYARQKELIASMAPLAKDLTNQRVSKRGQIDEVQRANNRNKSRVRAPRGARVCLGQAALGLHESAIPQPAEERHALVRRAGAGQPLPSANAPSEMIASAMGAQRACGVQIASTEPKILPSAPADFIMRNFISTPSFSLMNSAACSVLP